MAKQATGKHKKNSSSEAMPSLLGAVLRDLLIRHGLLSLLVIGFIGSAMKLAQTGHQIRRSTADLQALKDEYQHLQIKWESARLEMAALTEPSRIASLAKKQLKMIEVNSKNEKVIGR